MKMKTLLVDLAPAVPSEAVVLRSLAVTLVAMPYSQGDSPPWSQAGFRTSWPCIPCLKLQVHGSVFSRGLNKVVMALHGSDCVSEPSPNQRLWPGE